MQNHHNLIYREEEREMFPTLKVWRRVRLLLMSWADLRLPSSLALVLFHGRPLPVVCCVDH